MRTVRKQLKSQDAIVVIGEGITEKYYIESLKGLTRFNLTPKSLNRKASSLTKLNSLIKVAINEGYDKVLCLIDMDTKTSGVEKEDYIKLKNTYIGNESVCFFETHRCIELWFYYYFKYTSKVYNSCDEIIKDLHDHWPQYEKTEVCFKRCGGIHSHLEKLVGRLNLAMVHAKRSIDEIDALPRTHTYSDMHDFFEKLGLKIENKKR